MNPVQEVLFGAFPRRVGTPSQHWVFNEAQFDTFLDTVDGSRNVYATVGTLPIVESQDAESDKVLYDLDGDKSPFPDDFADDRRVSEMRRDIDLANEVLGDVCEEAQQLARASRDDGIPVVGVYSGFGIHVHQLYKPTTDPKVPMTTCASRYIDQLDLQTADWAVVGQPERICRVPNVQRVTHDTGRHQAVRDGRKTGLYTVPLTHEELEEVTPEDLLRLSNEPREIAADDLSACERSQMPIWEEYRDGVAEKADEPQRPVDSRTTPAAGKLDIERLLQHLLKMPCMVQRILQPNPEHEVRLNVAVMLFNVGMTPEDVTNIYGQLGWVDFDRNVTKNYLKDIYRSGYSDMSCRTLREEKLLCVQDDPSDCSCYGWSGGEVEWQ